MSAFLCSNDTLNALTTYLSIKANSRFDSLDDTIRRIGYQISDSDRANAYALRVRELRNAGRTSEQIIFQILLDDNIASLKARYPNDYTKWNWEDYAYQPSRAVKEWIRHKQTARLIGIASCYSYQSCEHDEWRDSPGCKVLDAIRYYLLQDFESCSGFANSQRLWDFNEETETASTLNI